MSVGVAVVLGLSPTGLYAIRELGRAGFDVYGIDAGRQCGNYSRYLSTSWSLEPGDSALQALLELAEREGQRGVIIPTSDAWIEWLCQRQADLSARWSFAPAYSDGVAAALLDKSRFYELCKSRGLAAPGCWVGGAEQLAGYAPEARYPCLLKPSLIHAVKHFMAGRKLFVAQSQQELLALLDSLPPVEIDWMLQEMIPGPESGITLYAGYFDGDSQPRQAFTCRKLRQYPPGFGSASLVQSEILDETRTLSERFLQGIGFRGIAGTEFKFDERDGELKVIEINPRPTLWFAASHHSGKRVALAAALDLLGGAQPEEIPQRENLRWRYLVKDLYSAAWYQRQGGNSVLPVPDVDPGADVQTLGPLLDSRDPLPLWGELRNYLGKIGSRLGR